MTFRSAGLPVMLPKALAGLTQVTGTTKIMVGFDRGGLPGRVHRLPRCRPGLGVPGSAPATAQPPTRILLFGAILHYAIAGLIVVVGARRLDARRRVATCEKFAAGMTHLGRFVAHSERLQTAVQAGHGKVETFDFQTFQVKLKPVHDLPPTGRLNLFTYR
ncbi:MAG: hypothetical protein ACRDSR_13670 [Pseudonocardiaceae bacterium]